MFKALTKNIIKKPVYNKTNTVSSDTVKRLISKTFPNEQQNKSKAVKSHPVIIYQHLKNHI